MSITDGFIFGEYFFNCKLYKANFLIREIDDRADVTFCIDLARMVTDNTELQLSLMENFEVHPILMMKEKPSKDKSWKLDSGAGTHVTGDSTLLINARPVISQALVNSNGDTMQVTHVGDVRVGNVIVTGVSYCKRVDVNLISVSKLADKGCSATFGKNEAIVMKNGRMIFRAKRAGNLFVIDTQCQEFEKINSVRSLYMWHRILGHANINDVKSTLGDRGIAFKNQDVQNCETCLRSKFKRSPFKEAIEQKWTFNIGELVSTDVEGPMRTRSVDGYLYNFKFVDYRSRYIHIAFGRTKDLASGALKQFIPWLERRIPELCSVIKEEYVNNDLKTHLLNLGIDLQLTATDIPSTNGQVERMNGVIMTKVRSLLYNILKKDCPWELVHKRKVD
jgi:hypothetical protein